MRNVRKEILSENDLHKDPLIDVVMKSAVEEFKFIDLSVSPFRCGLVSTKQIETCIDYAMENKNKLRRAHFDATGSIFGKIGKFNGFRLLGVL